MALPIFRLTTFRADPNRKIGGIKASIFENRQPVSYVGIHQLEKILNDRNLGEILVVFEMWLGFVSFTQELCLAFIS